MKDYNERVEQFLVYAINMIMAKINNKHFNKPLTKGSLFYEIYSTKNFHIRPYKVDDEDDSPNFYYKPLNLRVWWYKYLGRQMIIKCDVNLTINDIIEMINVCCKDITNSEENDIVSLDSISKNKYEEVIDILFSLKRLTNHTSIFNTLKIIAKTNPDVLINAYKESKNKK